MPTQETPDGVAVRAALEGSGLLTIDLGLDGFFVGYPRTDEEVDKLRELVAKAGFTIPVLIRPVDHYPRAGLVQPANIECSMWFDDEKYYVVCSQGKYVAKVRTQVLIAATKQCVKFIDGDFIVVLREAETGYALKPTPCSVGSRTVLISME